MRYVEKKKIPFSNAPMDDRNLPDLHLGLYDDVIVFDHVEKVILFSVLDKPSLYLAFQIILFCSRAHLIHEHTLDLSLKYLNKSTLISLFVIGIDFFKFVRHSTIDHGLFSLLLIDFFWFDYFCGQL